MNWNDIIGKTIKSVDERFINTVGLEFTDGTKVVIDTESIKYGLTAPILKPASEYEFEPDGIVQTC